MIKLKLYVKPFKKYFDVISIDMKGKLIVFDNNQVEKALVNKNKGDLWNVKSWYSFEKLTKKYKTNSQWTSGISFKIKYISFPKGLSYLKEFMKEE